MTTNHKDRARRPLTAFSSVRSSPQGCFSMRAHRSIGKSGLDRTDCGTTKTMAICSSPGCAASAPPCQPGEIARPISSRKRFFSRVLRGAARSQQNGLKGLADSRRVRARFSGACVHFGSLRFHDSRGYRAARAYLEPEASTLKAFYFGIITSRRTRSKSSVSRGATNRFLLPFRLSRKSVYAFELEISVQRVAVFSAFSSTRGCGAQLPSVDCRSPPVPLFLINVKWHLATGERARSALSRIRIATAV